MSFVLLMQNLSCEDNFSKYYRKIDLQKNVVFKWTLVKTEGAISNEQPRDTDNTMDTQDRTNKTLKHKTENSDLTKKLESHPYALER